MRLRSTAGANRLLSEAGLAVPPGPTSDQEALRVVRSASLLSEAEIEAIGVRQRKTGMPFHEAASDLGLLDPETFDLLIAQGGGLHLLDGGDPRIDPLVTAAFEASSPYVAKVRAVRAKLLSASSRPRSFGTRHRLALISVNGDDEAAILAANLAVVLAQMDGPTVVIDANVEEPSLDRLFRLPNRVGLAEQIVGATLDLPIAATAVDALWLMPAA
jgi:Mrp family chromosome partitioning ATPase